MPPKRKGKSATAGTARKAKVAKEQEVDDKKRNAAEQEEEATKKEEKESVGEVGDASGEKKDEIPAEEKKDDAKEEEVLAASAAEKPKARGRKKKESAPLVPGTKRVTRSNPGPKEEEKDKEKASSKAQIIIEHCKQCSSFKTRAVNIQSLLIEADPGLKISINPEKPRKGYFEIRDSTGRIFLSLKDMTRPFDPLKALDLEETAQNVLKELT